MDAAASARDVGAGRKPRERARSAGSTRRWYSGLIGFTGERTPARAYLVGPSADGEVVWSWRPKLASSLVVMRSARPSESISHRQGDGGNWSSSPRGEHEGHR